MTAALSPPPKRRMDNFLSCKAALEVLRQVGGVVFKVDDQ